MAMEEHFGHLLMRMDDLRRVNEITVETFLLKSNDVVAPFFEAVYDIHKMMADVGLGPPSTTDDDEDDDDGQAA